MPPKPLGISKEILSHSITFSSSSVADGEVCQSIHCKPIVFVKISANTEAGAAFAGK